MTQRSEAVTSAPHPKGTARRWNLVAAAIAALTGITLALVPFTSSITIDSTGATSSTSASLVSREGRWILILLAVPALLTLLPLPARAPAVALRMRWAVVALLGAMVLLGAMTIGVFLVPTLGAMIVSAVSDRADEAPTLRQPQAPESPAVSA